MRAESRRVPGVGRKRAGVGVGVGFLSLETGTRDPAQKSGGRWLRADRVASFWMKAPQRNIQNLRLRQLRRLQDATMEGS